MGIEAYPELADILLGRGASERPGAPEPTLLPHLAPYIATETIESLCYATDVCAGGRSGVAAWPDLRNAVFMTLASRLGAGSHARDLLKQFPALAAFLLDDAVVPDCLHADPDPHSGYRSDMLVRLAARFPQYGDGALLSAARNAVVNSDPWERDRLLGWLAVAVDAAERREVLGEMLAGGSPDPESVAALLPLLEVDEQDRLILHLVGNSDAGDPDRAAALMHLLPPVGPQARGALLEIVRPGLRAPGGYRPGWFCGLVVARLNLSGEGALALNLAKSYSELEPAWAVQLRALAGMEFGDFPFRDVLYTHPGAAMLMMERIGLDGMPEPLPGLILQILYSWGGSGPAEEMAPPPEPLAESAPPPTRSRGVAGRMGEVGRRMRRAMRGRPAEAPSPTGRGIPSPEPRPPEPLGSEDEARDSTGPERFLQADVFLRDGENSVWRTRSFERGGIHEIRVSIGPPEAGRTQLDQAFPDHLLPPKETAHELTVLLVAPGVFDGALSRTIKLPRAGPSEVATFEVTVPDDAETVEMMVIVLHRGTHLQTGYLGGPATAGEQDPSATGFTFRSGQQSAADLDHGEKPGLTIYKDGRQLVVHRPGHPDRTPSMAGLDSRLEKIREALFDAANGVFQLDSDLSSGPGLRLLRILAAQGEFMRRKLFGTDPLNEVRRIQVVSPYSADFFPAEYFYDRRAPRPDAALCPTFAGSSGASASCEGCTAADDGSIVCPMGFWGLNRVIERQVRPIDLAGGSPPEPHTGDDMLPAVGGVVLAASDNVNDDNPNEVSEMLAALGEITQSRAYLAEDWGQWRDLSSRHQPALLVALPHNVDNELGFQALQIGSDQELALNEIGVDYRPPPESVILLLGCNTAAAAVEYEDFIAGLRGAGAAVVVGTITYVLGMQAAPVAREFVRQLWSHPAARAIPMGELVRAVRTRMVRDGNPLALAMAAYGCADWRLAPRKH